MGSSVSKQEIDVSLGKATRMTGGDQGARDGCSDPIYSFNHWPAADAQGGGGGDNHNCQSTRQSVSTAEVLAWETLRELVDIRNLLIQIATR